MRLRDRLKEWWQHIHWTDAMREKAALDNVQDKAEIKRFLDEPQPSKTRKVPNGVRPIGFYDDRLIPGGGENIGMVDKADGRNRLEFPLNPEEVKYFRTYYKNTFGVERKDFDKLIHEHQPIALWPEAHILQQIREKNGSDAYRNGTVPATDGLLPEPALSVFPYSKVVRTEYTRWRLQGVEGSINEYYRYHFGNEHLPRMHPADQKKIDDVVAKAEKLLKPRLAVNNDQAGVRFKEPQLFDLSARRHLTEEWMAWALERYGCDHQMAWEMGAKKLIENEFRHGTMLKNVQILPRDMHDPLKVSIKYNDPGKL